MVTVSISLAMVCFLGQCHPALVGQETPSGVFSLQQAKITAPGYGGDVLLFSKRSDGVHLAIHRVWLGSPKQRRAERLASPVAAYRQGITGGCINVAPEVYAALVDCCSNHRLTIQP